MAKNSKTLNVPERRRISDLYKDGERLVLEDKSAAPIAVWVERLSPIDTRAAMRGASAARAKVKAMNNFGTDEEARAAFVAEAEMDGMTFDRESLMVFLGSHAAAEKRKSHESRIGAKDEWAEDGYLEGLLESWNGADGENLEERWLLDNDDEEASAVHDALMKWVTQVDAAVQEDIKQYERDNAEKSDDELFNDTVDLLIEAEAENVWYQEWQRQQIFYATRDPKKHQERYFLNREEVDSCDPRPLGQILEVLGRLNVSSLEGKD